jgi:hypothetical protein
MAMPSTETPWGTPEPKATGHGALRDLLRGLRAGDLAALLLTVAMAAEENRMPSADPEEEARILAFLARLAEHDAALPALDAADARPEPPVGGVGAQDSPPGAG